MLAQSAASSGIVVGDPDLDDVGVGHRLDREVLQEEAGGVAGLAELRPVLQLQPLHDPLRDRRASAGR